MANVRLTENRSPGVSPTYGAVCVTCGMPLLEPSRRRRLADRARRRHERAHRRHLRN
jgi:hypothetical protein